jgi:hypothetical protein
VLPSEFLDMDARDFGFNLLVAKKAVENESKIAEKHQKDLEARFKRRG